MIALDISIIRDEVSPALRRLTDALQDERLLPVFARSVENAMRDNFDQLEETRPNKLGGKREHYYSGARKLTEFKIDGNTAYVFTTQVGMRLRYFGGTVEAGKNISAYSGQPTKYLTIPANAEAYGHVAADFGDLEVLWGRKGPYALGRVERRTIARTDGTFGVSKALSTEVMFWLTPSVNIPSDVTMLPETDKVVEDMTGDFNRYVAKVWRRLGYEGDN
jgi:hypothetical protein